MNERRSAKDIFAEVIERAPADRAAYLDLACAGDAALRAVVEELIALHESAPQFMASPTVAPGAAVGDMETVAAAARAPGVERPGSRIGPYRLLEQIGEGGFGQVFVAEQTQPVQRRVALKVIKLGMDTRQVIARFEAERQALAMMEHPNIARVFDAGATETGRPYFVMELVRGEPITAYCDRHRLGIEQRLELFMQTCEAIQHAHQKGIIHRDIKPSNVLVTSSDGRAIPKVIDFGIAKATSARLTERTLFTEHRQIIGTPEYMSPEQAETTARDIDTRSDIYSLGVLLYELLTGALPFDSRRLRSAAFAEIQRIIREEDPPSPSARLSALETLANVAACRVSEPDRLMRAVRGDLDWVVMKCLEKDRARRYATAIGLSEDIRRHLRAEPVVAAPPGVAYRVRKFVRRHRAGVVFGAGIAAALLLGTTGTTLGMVRAAAAEREQAELRGVAEASAAQAREEADRARRAEAEAQQRAAELRDVTAFQASQLMDIDAAAIGAQLRRDILERRRSLPPVERSHVEPAESDVQLLERLLAGVSFTDVALAALDGHILGRALHAAEERFAGQPLVRAGLLQTLADTLRKLGLLERAMAPQAEALAIRRELLGGEHADTITSINGMGRLMLALGRHAESESQFREALQAGRQALGNGHAETLSALGNLGLVLQMQGRLADAEPYCLDAVNLTQRFLGDDHAGTVTALNYMGRLLKYQGRHAEAESYYRRALEGYRRVQGTDHPDTLVAAVNLGALLRAEGRYAEAESLYLEALEIRRRVLGEDHPDTLTSLNNMGQLLQYQGRLAEAEPYARETLDRTRRLLGETHQYTLISLNNLALLLRMMGRLDEAEPHAREAVDRMRRVLGSEHQNTLNAINNLGALLRAAGRLDEAEGLVREALETRVRVLGRNHLESLDSLSNLGVLLREQGRLEEADRSGADAVERARTALTSGHYVLGLFLVQHGRTLLALERHADAAGRLLEGHAILSAALGQAHRHTLDAESAVVELYDAWHAAEPHAGHDVEADAWRKRRAAPDDARPAGR